MQASPNWGPPLTWSKVLGVPGRRASLPVKDTYHQPHGVFTLMPDVARVLREEVQRLAKRQVKAGLSPITRDTVHLKKHVADLRRELTALTRTSRELPARVTAVVATKETEVAMERAAALRPTSKSLARLRRRLDLTQVEFDLSRCRSMEMTC